MKRNNPNSKSWKLQLKGELFVYLTDWVICPDLCTRTVTSFLMLFLSVLLSYQCGMYFNRHHQSVNNHLWTCIICIFLIRQKGCSFSLVCDFFPRNYTAVSTTSREKGHLCHIHLTLGLSCLSLPYMILHIQIYRCSL